MSKKNSIFFVGPMGAGKTTIGKQIAKKMSKTFYDTDQEIIRRTGVDIARIFEIESEHGFRRRESAILAELAKKENIVLSTGGGSVLLSINRQILRSHGQVIYLKSTAKKILKRVTNDRHRPLLRVDDKLKIIKQILKERESLYMEVADAVVNIGNLSRRQILKAVLNKLAGHENS